MDKEIFVQNIKKFCMLKGIKPTVACRDSGAGTDLINQVERRGSVPSVERVQMLAAYLGVTTSELLGENVEIIRPGTPAPGDPAPDLIVKFRDLSPDDQEEVMAIIELKRSKDRKNKGM